MTVALTYTASAKQWHTTFPAVGRGAGKMMFVVADVFVAIAGHYSSGQIGVSSRWTLFT